MEQLLSVPAPGGSFAALLRACRHRALLSQEQLAAGAEVSERTVRDLEAGRVRSPRSSTVRLLADALQLTGPQRDSWFAAARGANHQRAEQAELPAGGAAHQPGDAPAQLPLPASGTGMGHSVTRRCLPTTEFPAETIAQCQRDGRMVGQVAQGADPDEAAARSRAGRTGRDGGARGDDLLACANRRELTELRRENRRLREDVEILKRATAIFATATR